ncbi:MAG: AmmeMemoRadiSam system radical SAM enzyme [Bacteroidales bacterium]|nr:AmmeMemoRadiSam system radical SAM enzyme [Bacteroidales bacterium]
MSLPDSESSTRLALYQERLPGNVVRCLLCPHRCVLQEWRIGICHARINRWGELYTLGYGNPCSIAVDPIEKKPLFHFLPGRKIFSMAMAGCNLRCLNCQNWEISQSSPDDLKIYDLTPEEVLKLAEEHHVDCIAFTYTEPSVFYEYVFDIAKTAHDRGFKIVLVTNGYINEKPLLELCPYLDAVNVDLKCIRDDVYRRLSGGNLQPVIDTLKILKAQGVWLEITNLLVPGITDRSDMVHEMCDWLVKNGFEDTPLHFSRFFPAYKLDHLKPTPEDILLQAKMMAEAAGIKYVYIGNDPDLNGENTFCPKCKHMVVERSGYVVRQNVVQDGLCHFCGERIPGVWS